MTKLKKIKSFIYTFCFGILLLFLSFFTFVSLITHSELDPYFGNSNASENINNFFGILGSYFGGTSYVFFSNLSYFVPIFFLILGFKKIIGNNKGFFIIYFFSFFLSIISISFLLNYFSLDGGLAGKLIYEILYNNFQNYFNNNFFVILFLLIIIFLTTILLFYGLSIKLKTINKINYLFSLVIILILRFFKILNPVNIFKSTKSNLAKNLDHQIDSIKNTSKREPTLKEKKNANGSSRKNIDYNELNDNEYKLPPLSLLNTTIEKKINIKEIEKINEINSKKLEEILKEYGVEGNITNYKTGPIVTLFEFLPAPGIKTSKVIGLSADIARSMSSMSARISSQPGKSSIGIELPNNERQNVILGDLLNDNKFQLSKNGLVLALGKTISGEKTYTDLEQMPHLLIAGTTGSGKSVGINCMILSLLFKYKPSECKLILIDPKMLELSIYEEIPHLLTPVVTDPKKAVFALKWVVREMENRYRIMSSTSVKNIKSFNDKISKFLSSGKKLYREVQTGIDSETRIPIVEKQEIPLKHMPLIVVVIDEMADLMMVAGKEVEQLVQRLAQMARASGIHLIAATQRPSVDVITGTIKANFPSRISFRVASRFDSRTILNEMGAEQLLGSGDMLFLENGANINRLHGGFVSEAEIENIVNFINSQSTNEYQVDITKEVISNINSELSFDSQNRDVDELYQKAISIVIYHQKASTSFIQRNLQIGYNRAARIIEKMEEEGIITEANHVGKRNVLKKNN